MLKKIGIILVVFLIIVQLIRPGRNAGEIYTSSDISKATEVPDDIKVLLDKSCNDCHSNYTNYDGLWYMNIQPVGWWINHHIEEGKEHLNFSEFNTYSLKRKLHKLEEIAEQLEEHEMPLNSYLWMHSDAKLSNDERNQLISWANLSIKRLSETNQDN